MKLVYVIIFILITLNEIDVSASTPNYEQIVTFDDGIDTSVIFSKTLASNNELNSQINFRLFRKYSFIIPYVDPQESSFRYNWEISSLENIIFPSNYDGYFFDNFENLYFHNIDYHLEPDENKIDLKLYHYNGSEYSFVTLNLSISSVEKIILSPIISGNNIHFLVFNKTAISHIISFDTITLLHTLEKIDESTNSTLIFSKNSSKYQIINDFTRNEMTLYELVKGKWIYHIQFNGTFSNNQILLQGQNIILINLNDTPNSRLLELYSYNLIEQIENQIYYKEIIYPTYCYENEIIMSRCNSKPILSYFDYDTFYISLFMGFLDNNLKYYQNRDPATNLVNINSYYNDDYELILRNELRSVSSISSKSDFIFFIHIFIISIIVRKWKNYISYI